MVSVWPRWVGNSLRIHGDRPVKWPMKKITSYAKGSCLCNVQVRVNGRAPRRRAQEIGSVTEAVRYYLGTGASRESDAPSNVMPRLTKSLSRQARGVRSISPSNTRKHRIVLYPKDIKSISTRQTLS